MDTLIKILICAHGLVGYQVIRHLLEKHGVTPNNMLVFSYDTTDNIALFSYLKNKKVKYTTLSIREGSGLELALAFGADVVASTYGREIIPSIVLDRVTRGTFNMHPSLLPKYRGCFSIPWAIFNNETNTGITFHEMIKNVDKGKILFQKTLPIYPDDTAYLLYHRVISRFMLEFDNFYERFINNELAPREMPAGGSFYRRGTPFGGIINPSWARDKIDSFIRAMYFPPMRGAIARFGKEDIEVDTINQYTKLTKENG